MNRLALFLIVGVVALGVVGGLMVVSATTDDADASSRDANRNATPGEQAPPAEPSGKEESDVETRIATFGAGCFWGVELKFDTTEGVVKAESGYMGGKVDKPTYKQVCTDTTGHAEVVQVTYDPEKITYDQLLDIFWHLHDPTQVNRQGPDWGTQYRTVIFYHDDAQKGEAEKSRAALQASDEFKAQFGDKKIATEIVPAKAFWKAEDYHQDYFAKKGMESCHVGW